MHMSITYHNYLSQKSIVSYDYCCFYRMRNAINNYSVLLIGMHHDQKIVVIVYDTKKSKMNSKRKF